MESVDEVNKKNNFSQTKSVIWIAEEELGAKTAGDNKEKVQISFKNKLFTKGPVFSKSNGEAARNFCQKYYARNVVNLIVESQAYLTVWVEHKPNTSMNHQSGGIQEREQANNNNLPRLVACIDDSKTVQRQVKMTLEPVGYLVMNILEPSSTLSKLATQKPAVIFMDINMPEINGYELCLMLQRSRKFKNVPVVMLTGQEGDGPRTKAKFVGATDYLTKPFDPQQYFGF